MAKELKVDTGLTEYVINGDVTVRFNPADAGFTERLYDVFSQLESRQGEFQKRVDEIGDDADELFSYARERDAEMRGCIDGLLGDGVADKLFPNMNCYALSDGMPVWMNLMLALAEEVQEAYSRERSGNDPRMKRISDKNAELLAKYKKATTK